MSWLSKAARQLADWLEGLKHLPVPPVVFPPQPVPVPTDHDPLDLVNVFRHQNGKPPFVLHWCLNARAMEHAKWVAALPVGQRYDHAHDGFSDRAAQCGMGFCAENWASGSTAAEAVRQWTNSPPHRAAMLGDYQLFGGAVVPGSAVMLVGTPL